LLTAISCKTVSRAVVVLPNVPGANYIGSKECEQCHEEIYRDFASADHGRLITQGKNALNAGCESCHGPASLHAESGGEVKTPNTFTAGRPQTMGSNSRLGMKASTGISESVCFECHANVRGEFNLPHHHPVPEGRMTCTECHSPHKGNAHMRGGAALLAQNDNCLACHASQRGPHVFEHEAMREGCAACHKPHGSVNAKMLTVRDSNLCLKCHFQQQGPGGAILIGGSDHRVRLSQGTCWTAGCHEAVHGSRVNSSLRF
jgi:predicted CXXCH cytochrome family protein